MDHDLDMMNLSDGAKADLLYVASNEPVRLSALDGAAELVAAGLLDGDESIATVTLDGCDAVDELRRQAA